MSTPSIWAMESFLLTPWKQLANVTTKEDADFLLENIADLSTYVDLGFKSKFCIQWESECPSCFECQFKDPPPAHGHSFSCMKPLVCRESIVLKDCPVLDDETGVEISKTIHIEVISCDPLISSADAEAFKFRAADEQEHCNYETFVPKQCPKTVDREKVEYWQLVRSSGSESQAMSLIRIGCLDSIFKNQSVQEETEASNEILSLLRGQAGYRKKDSKKAPSTLTKAIAKVGLVDSWIRVNRVGGPMGHAGGMKMSTIRRDVVSPFVSGAVPRNRALGNIVVPFQLPDSAVAFASPFYIGVKQQDTLAVASAPHNSIPSHGFVSPGSKVFKAFQECEVSKHLQVLRTFTATVYSGARILRELAIQHPGLTTSQEAVKLTLLNEERRRRVFTDKDFGPSTCTRSRQDDGRQYSKGQAVFVYTTDANNGEFKVVNTFLKKCSLTLIFVTVPAFPATIHKVMDDLKYEVKWSDDPSDPGIYRFPQELIRPCVLLDSENRGDDDDLVPVAPSEHDKTLSSQASVFNNILDALGALGEYTTVFDCIFGHTDHFTHTDAPLLENKISFPQGKPDESVKLNSFLQSSRVPPAGLAYPRYKVATISFATSDVELHCLHSEVHFGPRQERSDGTHFRRGSWLRDGDDTLFFPEGAAVLDWTSRENHSHRILRTKKRARSKTTQGPKKRK
jgi:hypothetical protein